MRLILSVLVFCSCILYAEPGVRYLAAQVGVISPNPIDDTTLPISIPGYYALSSDVGGITITANNVILLLNGHTVLNSSGDALVANNVQNIKIKGPGTITSTTGNGISMTNTINITIEHCTILDCSDGAGIYLNGCDSGWLNNCDCIANQKAISLNQTTNVVVDDCTATRNTQSGFYLTRTL